MAIDGLNTGSLSEQLVGAQIVATAGNGYIAAELLGSEGADTLSSVGDVQVTGPLVVSEVGSDTLAGIADAVVSGALVVSEVGSDTFAGAGSVEVYAVFSATEGALDSASIAGAIQVAGAMATTEAIDTIYVLGNVQVHGYEDASESPDSATGDGDVIVDGALATQDTADTAAGDGVAQVAGSLTATESGLDTFEAQGNVIGGETVAPHRSRRLSIRSIADTKVFCRGGQSLTSCHSPVLVVINPSVAGSTAPAPFVEHGQATALSRTITSHGGMTRAIGGTGGKSTLAGGHTATFSTFADAFGVAVAPVLGRGAYKTAVTAGRTAVASGHVHHTASGSVRVSAVNAAAAKGTFAVSDAHFCRARGERRLPHTHTVAITAMVTHGRFRRNVDTRTR